jgi:nucleoid-associated protein YgaU
MLWRLPLLAVAVALLMGCVNLGSYPVSSRTEARGDLWKVKRPGIAPSVPASGGLAGLTVTGVNAFYRVAKTDTLVSIAERFYGDRRYAEKIAELNNDALMRAGGLKRAMVIALPRVEEAAGDAGK